MASHAVLTKRGLALLAFAGAILAPALALACPYCATQSETGSSWKVALGALILLPFAVAAVIISIIRSAARDEQERPAPTPYRDPISQFARRREAE